MNSPSTSCRSSPLTTPEKILHRQLSVLRAVWKLLSFVVDAIFDTLRSTLFDNVNVISCYCPGCAPLHAIDAVFFVPSVVVQHWQAISASEWSTGRSRSRKEQQASGLLLASAGRPLILTVSAKYGFRAIFVSGRSPWGVA